MTTTSQKLTTLLEAARTSLAHAGLYNPGDVVARDVAVTEGRQ